jgi:DNA-binding response OmpR family regulator
MEDRPVLAILCVGEDADLLNTRAELLRTTSATVMQTRSVAALKFMKQRRFDLIILCHTVPHEAAKKISLIAHSIQEKSFVLLLTPSLGHEERRCHEIDFDVMTGVDPASLLSTVAKVLSRRISTPENQEIHLPRGVSERPSARRGDKPSGARTVRQNPNLATAQTLR